MKQPTWNPITVSWAILACVLGWMPIALASVPTVRVNGETLLGSPDERFPAVAAFKGVPFAAPPLGKLRWAAPQPHRRRVGVQSAREFPAGCYQDNYNSAWYGRVARAFGASDAVFTAPPFSEDCLYLNVWTPASAADRPLPVMVWIHGGSNKAGWSFEPNYQGAALAARAHVVVSVAYRLGVFGYFGHPSLRGTRAPTNFGLLDQVAALHWVQREAHAFGGDPSNVTIFGESAGAANVAYLMASPLASGLFRRAISQSGGYVLQESATLASAEQVGTHIAAALPGRPDLAALRRLSSERIFGTARERLGDHNWGPVVDGRSVLAPAAANLHLHGMPVDLLVGSNQNESYMYVDGDPGSLSHELASLPAAVRDRLSSLAAQEPTPHLAHDRVSTLVEMGCPPYLMAASAVASGHRAWVYRFNRVRPGAGSGEFLAYHGAEIPYIFDSHDVWLSGDAVDGALTDAMIAYWGNFARDGDPNGSGLVRWPSFDASDARVMELGARIGSLPAPEHALCVEMAGELYPGWRG